MPSEQSCCSGHAQDSLVVVVHLCWIAAELSSLSGNARHSQPSKFVKFVATIAFQKARSHCRLRPFMTARRPCVKAVFKGFPKCNAALHSATAIQLLRGQKGMSAGYLVPVTVKVSAAASKGQGVFAAAPVTKGALLWRPNHVKAVPAEEITSTLAAMPYEQASVSSDQ